MNILILGADGRQGLALQTMFDLLSSRFNSEIEYVCVDKKTHSEKSIVEAVLQDWDLVFSCLPYVSNMAFGAMAIGKQTRWADLGSHVESCRVLVRAAQSKGVPIATDLGLAPGLIEYLGFSHTEEGTKQMTMFCGGLPLKKTSEFGYQIVFSPQGVVNNYVDPCEALIENHIIEVQGMWDNRMYFVDDLTLEAANSSGGVTWLTLKKMMELGLHKCRYQTLRYPGHWERAVKAWQRYSQAPTDAEARADMANWISRHAQQPDKDVVFIAIEADHRHVYNARIDARDGMSAMQLATSAPAACAAVLLAEGEFDFARGPVGAHDIANHERFWKMLYKVLPEVE